jgi:aspartate aminotransferase
MSNYQSHSSSNPNSIAQYASQAALSGSQERVGEMAAEFDRRRHIMVGMINSIPGLSANMPEGAFYVMMNVGRLFGRKIYGRAIDSASAFAEALLNEEGVAVVPGEAFEAPNHVRVSYAVSGAHIIDGLDRISSFVSKLES